MCRCVNRFNEVTGWSADVIPLQFAFQAPCCSRWFDCGECHAERSDHRLAAARELAFLCKACGKPFRKDLQALGEEDERCPHCANTLSVVVASTDR